MNRIPESGRIIETDPNAENKIDLAIRQLEEKYSHNSRLDQASNEIIAEKEAEKQKVLLQLREDLKSLEGSDKWVKTFPNARPVKYDELSDGFVVANTRNAYLTEGEIITDAEWGAYYNLDASVDKEMRRRYLIETASLELRRLLNEQITAEESSNPLLEPGKRKAYLARELEPDESHAGLIAEKLVRTMLKKISIDNGAGFLIEEADIRQDVENKIDFIIHLDSNKRGVGVTSTKADRGIRTENVGIQFSINSSKEAAQRKNIQLAKVKTRLGEELEVADVVLITIPMKNVIDLLKNWKGQPKPGGPDKLWDAEKRRKIIWGVLDKLMPRAEIEAISSSLTTTK